MNNDISIFLAPDGNSMQYVHTEEMDLDGLGEITEAPRVSDVEFDPVDKNWVARLLDGKEIAREKSRAAAILRERHVINAMMARGEEIPGLAAH